MGRSGWLIFWLILAWLAVLPVPSRAKQTAVIVGVFDSDAPPLYRNLFEFTIERHNSRQRTTTTSQRTSQAARDQPDPLLFEPRTILVAKDENFFHLWKRVCRNFDNLPSDTGIIAFVAPPWNAVMAEKLASLAESKRIPLLSYTSDSTVEPPRPSGLRTDTFSPSIATNYFPPTPSVSLLTSQLLTKHWRWRRFAILYQSPFDVPRARLIAPLLRSIGGGALPSMHAVIVDEIEPKFLERKVREYRAKTGVEAAYRFVLIGDTGFLTQMLSTLRMYGMMTDEYHYHLLSWNLHRADFSRQFRLPLANITSMQLVDVAQQPQLQTLLKQYDAVNRKKMASSQQTTFPVRNVPIEIAYMLDSLIITMASFRNFSASMAQAEKLPTSGDGFDPLARDRRRTPQATLLQPNINCADPNSTWKYGDEFVQFTRQHVFGQYSLTGGLAFHQATGARLDFDMLITKLLPNGTFETTHMYESTRGDFVARRSFSSEIDEIKRKDESTRSDDAIMLGYATRVRSTQQLSGSGSNKPNAERQQRMVRVTSILDTPFLMFVKSADQLSGNDRFEGYAVDFVDALSKIIGFNYTIEVVKDSTYGSLLPNGEWNGMVGELLRGEADIAVAPMSISFDREQAIDFSKPFMAVGVSILYRRPAKMPPNLFSFIEPFSPNVWLYLSITCLAVTFLTYVLARFTPYEWYNPHRCDTESEIRTNNFNFSNTMWFAAGSLLQQGSDILPRAVSTRVLGGIWWIFTLIIVSSYTANLAAFLTVERVVLDIESAESLVNQKTIKYGCLQGGTTCRFFEKSRVDIYQRMWKAMISDPSNFVMSNEEGVKRVLQGGYAFFMESAGLEYRTQRLCDLVQIGGMLNSKGYGVALPENSDLRDPISNAILKLQENNELHKLKDKWWKQKGGGVCDSSGSGGSVNPLGMPNLGGVFVVLVVGLLAGPFIAALELVWKARDYARQDGVSVWKEVGLYLHFAAQCHFRSDEGVMNSARAKAVVAATAAAANAADESGQIGVGLRAKPQTLAAAGRPGIWSIRE